MGLAYVTPTNTLADELSEVAAAAHELLGALQESRANAPLPDDFPKDQLISICQSLISLPNGTAEGCRAPLDYARNRLPNIRREHIRVRPNQKEESGTPQLTRGAAVDTRLAHLMSAVSTAWDEYCRAAIEEPGQEPINETGILAPPDAVADAIDQGRRLDEAVVDTQSRLAESAVPSSVPADNLKRQLEDVRGLNRMGAAEVGMPKVVVTWYRKITESLKDYPQTIRKTLHSLRKGVDITEIAYDKGAGEKARPSAAIRQKRDVSAPG